MDRTAVFVDAGYLFAAGSQLITHEKLPRGELRLDHDAVLNLLASLATELTGLPLLRIYWYDGTGTGPTAQQLALSYRANVKLRLGFITQQRQQKGVDSLIVNDLINLSRNRAMADALLLTGDEDLRVGVQQAQEFGVRVHLIGIAPSRENQSGFLVQEADGVRELGLAEVQSFLSRAPVRENDGAEVMANDTPATAAEGEDALLAATGQRVAWELTTEEMNAALIESAGGSVPTHIDRRLLTAGTRVTGGALLTAEQKRTMRAAFLEACRNGVL